MDEEKQKLKGSDSRDSFKQWHKTLDKEFYATDIDFALVIKRPEPKIIAILDFKKHIWESITFSEVIAYNDFLKKGIPVYLFYAKPNMPPYEKITIKKYLGGNWKPNPPEVDLIDELVDVDIKIYQEWERKIRMKG